MAIIHQPMVNRRTRLIVRNLISFSDLSVHGCLNTVYYTLCNHVSFVQDSRFTLTFAHCFRRWLSELRGRAQQQPGRVEMDDAVAEARREEILPGDLLQGITASHFDLSSCYRRTRPAGHRRIISVPVTLSSTTSQPRRFVRASNARPVQLVIDLFGDRLTHACMLCIVATRNTGKPISLMRIDSSSTRNDTASSGSFSLRVPAWARTYVHRSRKKKKRVCMSGYMDTWIYSILSVSETLDSQVLQTLVYWNFEILIDTRFVFHWCSLGKEFFIAFETPVSQTQ